jgi:hypothetical protein
MTAPDHANVKYVATWLPCGIQNFDRDRTEFGVTFSSETSLLHRLFLATGVSATPRFHATNNLHYVWWDPQTAGTQWCYMDSDGFIFAMGTEPRFPELAAPAFFVARTSENDLMLWHDHWILTAVQANLLFEGVWNSSFNPAVFLLSRRTDIDRIEKAFNWQVLIESMWIGPRELTAPPDLANAMPTDLRSTVLAESVRRFRNDHLLPLKWNVEAARRRLFSETMTILHRQESLHQFSAGRAVSQDAPAVSRDDLFANASDMKLRGYVSLVSAKLPLIDNITYLMAEAFQNLSESGERVDDDPKVRTTRQIVESWSSLVGVLHENVLALEKSFENMWQNRMFHEIEQVRIEEESLGEQQREASQEREGKWFDTFLLVATLAATAGVLIDTVGKSETPAAENTGSNGLPGGESMATSQPSATIASSGVPEPPPTVDVTHSPPYVTIVASIIVVALGLYLGAVLFRRWIHGFVPKYEQVTRLDAPFQDPGAAKAPTAGTITGHGPGQQIPAAANPVAAHRYDVNPDGVDPAATAPDADWGAVQEVASTEGHDLLVRPAAPPDEVEPVDAAATGSSALAESRTKQNLVASSTGTAVTASTAVDRTHHRRNDFPTIATSWDSTTQDDQYCTYEAVAPGWVQVTLSREGLQRLDIDHAEVSFTALERCEVVRARVDTPSESDTFLRCISASPSYSALARGCCLPARKVPDTWCRWPRRRRSLGGDVCAPGPAGGLPTSRG